MFYKSTKMNQMYFLMVSSKKCFPSMIIKGWFHQILQRKCFISLWMMDPRPPDFHVMGAWKKNRVLERRDEKAPERSRPTLDLMIGCVDSSAAPWATAARGVPGRRLRPPLPAALGDFYLKKKRQTSFFRRLLLLRVPSSNHKSQRDGVRGPLPHPSHPKANLRVSGLLMDWVS